MQRSRSSAISGETGIGLSKVRFGKRMRVAPGPQRNVRSWSGHSPPLSQSGQSSGWFRRMNSRTAFWPSAAFALVCAVERTRPSWAVIVQAAWSFGMPSTSQRHMRQAPTGAPSLGS